MNKRYIKLTILMALGVFLMLVGGWINTFVIANNGGKMPVNNWNGIDNNPLALYQNATNQTKYTFFIDRQEWFGFSISDFVIYLGFILYLYNFLTILKYFYKEGKK